MHRRQFLWISLQKPPRICTERRPPSMSKRLARNRFISEPLAARSESENSEQVRVPWAGVAFGPTKASSSCLSKPLGTAQWQSLSREFDSLKARRCGSKLSQNGPRISPDLRPAVLEWGVSASQRRYNESAIQVYTGLLSPLSMLLTPEYRHGVFDARERTEVPCRTPRPKLAVLPRIETGVTLKKPEERPTIILRRLVAPVCVRRQ